MMKSKSALITLSLIALNMTTNLNAAYESHYTPMQCIPTEVFGMSGSNGDKKLIEIQQNMATVGSQLSTAIEQEFLNLTQTIQKSSGQIQSTIIETSEDALQKKLQLETVINEQELSMKLDKEKKSEMARRTIFFEDDTPQEIDLIIKTLEEQGDDVPVRDIAMILQIAYDDEEEGTISIPYHGSEDVCEEEDIKKGLCSTQKKIYPGRKLFTFFKYCSQQKAKLISLENEERAKNTAMISSAKKTQESIATTDSSASMSANINKQKEINCNVEQFKNKVCLTDLTKEEYQLYIVENKIIRNGNVSPTNMLYPTSVGGVGDGLVSSKENYEALEQSALNYVDAENFPHQDVRQVPIVFTYRNTSQLKSAVDFVDNITATNLISNQSPQERKKVHSLEYQTRYNSRIAALSLANSALMDSVTVRLGEQVSGQYLNDPTLESFNHENFYIESVFGAGELDHLYSEVDNLSGLLRVSGTDIDSSNKKLAMNGSTGEKYWSQKMYDVKQLQMKILLKRLMQGEKSLLLKAANLSSKANSVENVLYLKQLRNGG